MFARHTDSIHIQKFLKEIKFSFKTLRPKSDGSDKGDVQKVYCWCATMNRVGKKNKK